FTQSSIKTKQMKKIIFLAALAMFAICNAQAQVTPAGGKTKVIKTTVPSTIKTIPASTEAPPPPPPPPVSKTDGTTTTSQTVPVYALTSVRVKIRTGNDNKEFPSKVNALLMAKSNPNDWRNYIQINLGNEMRINSDTEFGLDLEGRAPTALTAFQSAGLKLSISYEPNFFADAWKIEGITLVLEFKDQNGNLHPTLGNKTIVFSNAYGFLNGEFRYIHCMTDASFAPLTSVITKTYQ
ncbi:MAG: hypothetical protein ABIR18_12665, partial [Chitinophagaceae bacterium]